MPFFYNLQVSRTINTTKNQYGVAINCRALRVRKGYEGPDVFSGAKRTFRKPPPAEVFHGAGKPDMPNIIFDTPGLRQHSVYWSFPRYRVSWRQSLAVEPDAARFVVAGPGRILRVSREPLLPGLDSDSSKEEITFARSYSLPQHQLSHHNTSYTSYRCHKGRDHYALPSYQLALSLPCQKQPAGNSPPS